MYEHLDPLSEQGVQKYTWRTNGGLLDIGRCNYKSYSPHNGLSFKTNFTFVLQ